MPKRVDKLSIDNEFLDKRVKLLSCQKEMIHYNYEKFSLSMRKLATIFKVDRRTIQFELFPERKLQNVQKRLERGGWLQYYTKDKNSSYIKIHRSNKDEINNQFHLI